ncbi:pseudouridine synthase [uncultured Clostridium sp.]|uniref:pseudouridine synthase n=1 Tax=uncultured Clostridium sp. TaxID=59620 RepID=UPI0026036260|nr:pseudouridine synthase [uncultured Clostridium sp.]
MRLDKFLAQAGIGKRKDTRKYIEDGLVKVNGKIIHVPAIEINENMDVIELNEEKVIKKEQVYYMLNKPKGYITATKDEIHKTVFDLFEEDMKGIFHIGRLDKDTEGLLLFTNDGEFEHKIMYPDKHIDKTYFFIALGNIDEDKKQSLEKGVYINKGEVLTKEAEINNIRNFQNLLQLEEGIKEKIDISEISYINQNIVCGELIIKEGKKHQVKKMLKSVGCKVIFLQRIAIGNLELDKKLKLGEYKKLREKEKEKIFRETI